MKFLLLKVADSTISILKTVATPFIKFGLLISFLFAKFSPKEKMVFFVLLSVLIVLIFFESLKIYYAQTKFVPKEGGEYVEIIKGEAKYFSPILVKSDAEKAVSSLIYSSLIKIDENNQPVPDLAESWQISEDSLQYNFNLKSGVFFHAGQEFTSQDVVATINSIQDENNKSPLKEMWTAVKVEAPDLFTVVFSLPKQYGPFIYNCNFKIISSSDTASSLSANYNGTGPYEFIKNQPTQDNNLEVFLEANKNYFAGTPLITKLKFIISQNPIIDINKINDKNINAIVAVDAPDIKGFNEATFKTGRNLILFSNIRKGPMQDIETRRKLFSGEKIEGQIEIKMVYLETDAQIQKAKEIENDLKDSGVKFSSMALPVHDYATSIENKDYDLLLYGYDWSYDLDLYLLWHSSQLTKTNFSGYSSKEDDIFLEDTRLIVEASEREKRYRDFAQKVTDLYLMKDYGQKEYLYFISDKIKNVQIIRFGRPEDRFNNVASWYIKEKRVKK